MIRSLALTTALLGLAAPSLAQTTAQAVPTAGETRSLAPTSSPAVAATLPNTFDGPARTPAASAGPTAPATSQAGVTDADIAEGALRVIIADLAQGQLDTDLFTTDLANRLRPQLTTLQPVVRGFGELGMIEAQGLSNGANQFLVIFENAATQWIIGLDGEGRVAALLFRPAPAVSSEPEEAPTTAVPSAPATEGQAPGARPGPPSAASIGDDDR
ncbi:hypothetical protein [Brevundimonas sp. AAP58]|uniref:hypothetical protein n=1 Tax=Brevundimonas sp. AAP58 TaxID=1523422 RepID=UPI0006B91A99|nr:hypothetical protein [Brevundimonas sp. AAP58]